MTPIIPAQRLTDAERATEAAQILARGVLRWHRERGQENALIGDEYSDVPLDFLPGKSVHADRYHQPENGA